MKLIFFNKKKICMILFYLFFFIPAHSEIPIIVISPSKTNQSLSAVGSDIKIISEEKILDSNNVFLDEIIDLEIPGSSLSRQGGRGTNSIIQLRGLPKRYANIYIDGVKQSDPSTPDNAFYLNNLTVGSIRSVEVLKGNQSSVYGSGAIAGVINIFSKNGKEISNKLLQVNYGSKNSKSIILNYGNDYKFFNYSLSLEKFLSDGISAMTDNTENDPYKNNSINASMGFDLNNQLRIETNFKFSDTALDYDEVTYGRTDKNNTNDENITSNIKIINEKDKYKNTIIFSHFYNKREVTNYDETEKKFYYGERKSLNYLGEYNFNLDKKLIFGIDNEFNRANFSTWAVSNNKVSDETVNSQYFDYQERISEKVYGTFGFRNDIHSTAGSFQTARFTSSYNLDNLTKYRSSIGSGIRFGSLNDYYYDNNVLDKTKLKPEKSYSIDFGLDKKFEEIKSNLSLTLFYTEYEDNISNWQSNTDAGSSSYVIDNSNGKIKSKGFDLSIENKINNSTNSRINYAYINSYDGEDCDDPNKISTVCSISSYPVRIPKHQLNASIEKRINSYLKSKINLKYVSSRRDYGNLNNSFNEVMLDDYIRIDLKNNMNFFGQNLYFSINNIFNEKYEDAYQYSVEGRSFNIGLNKKF